MPLTSVLGNSFRKPDVTFKRGGIIQINAPIARRLELEDGDSVDIIADDFECCLAVRHHFVNARFEAMVHRTNRRGRNFRAYSAKLCDYMCKRFNSDNVKLSMGATIHHQDYGTLVTLINRNMA